VSATVAPEADRWLGRNGSGWQSRAGWLIRYGGGGGAEAKVLIALPAKNHNDDEEHEVAHVR